MTLVVAVAVLLVAILGGDKIVDGLQSLRARTVRRLSNRPQFVLDKKTGSAIVPIRFAIEIFANMYEAWHPMGAGAAMLTAREDGTYDLTLATVPKPTASASLEDLEPTVREALKASIDLLHAVDELADPTVGIAQAATELREAVHPLIH